MFKTWRQSRFELLKFLNYWCLNYQEPNVMKHICEPRRQKTVLRYIRTVSSESTMDALRIVNDAKFHHTENENSDQTVPMRSLIWIFDGRTSEGTFFYVA